MKGRDHLLIGMSEVNALDLLITSSMSVPIRRDDKVKGFLEVSNFQLHTDKINETLDDDSVDSEESARDETEFTGSRDANETIAASGKPSVPVDECTVRHENKLIDDSPAKTAETSPVDSPDRSVSKLSEVDDSGSPAICDKQLPTDGDVGRHVSATERECSFESFETDLSSVSALSMPSVSMQISLEKLHTGKGKKKSLAGKVLNKAPSPFFDFAVLHDDENSSRW